MSSPIPYLVLSYKENESEHDLAALRYGTEIGRRFLAKVEQ
jgi:hypothetical protein